MEAFCARLEKLRCVRGLNRRQLAERIGVSPVTIANWEKGVSVPTADKLVLLQRVFRVGYEYILEGSGEPSV